MKGQTLKLPGLVDVHVHLREPGFSYKETIRTGTRAAAAGGFTCVCPMPNLNPVPDCPANLERELELIRAGAVIDVRPYCAMTIGRKGKETVDVKALKDSCVGFSDDGSGIQDESVMFGNMQTVAACGGIIAAHCEDNSLLKGGYIHDGDYARTRGHAGICSKSEWGQIARDLELCAATGCAYHVCHISTKESVELIRKAKARGVNVTCETAPHYLVFCDEDLQEDGRFKMNPPLRSSEDRSALIEGLLDGTIDMIATDHAPHSSEEKSKGLAHSAMGVVGLETSFPVMYTRFVRSGIISLEKLLELMCWNPRKRFGIPLHKGDTTEFDVSEPYVIDSASFLSMGKSSPFTGLEVYGRCLSTRYRGIKVF